MSHSIRWNPDNLEGCLLAAQEQSTWTYKGPSTGKYLYRLVDDQTDNGPRVGIMAFPVINETKNGCTIPFPNARKWRFVSHSTHRRYAYVDTDEALANYILRKTRHIAILKNKLDRIDKLKAMAENKPSQDLWDLTQDPEDMDDLRLEILERLKSKQNIYEADLVS